jgi:hypothetical protein
MGGPDCVVEVCQLLRTRRDSPVSTSLDSSAGSLDPVVG